MHFHPAGSLRSVILSLLVFATIPSGARAQMTEADRLDRASEFLDKAAEVRGSQAEIERLYEAQAEALDEEFRSIRREYDTATIRNLVDYAGNMASLAADLIELLGARSAKDRTTGVLGIIVHSTKIAETLASNQTKLPAAFRAAMAKYAADLKALNARRVQLEAAQRSYDALMQEATNAGLLRPSESGFARAPSDIGAWRLQLNGVPRAELPFDAASVRGSGPPVLKSLTLTCGPQNSIAYRIASAGKAYASFDITEGEDSTHVELETDGRLGPKEASKFAAAILKQLASYEKEKSKEQAIEFLLPDMHGDTVNFYGFAKVRAALKEACQKAAPAQQQAAGGPAAAPIDGGRELSAWRDVIAVVTRLRGSGACNLPPFTPAAVAGLSNVNQIPCSNGAGTRLSGMNGIGVFLNSVQNSATARVDNPLDVAALSSITVQIPSNLYTHVQPASIEAALGGIMGPLGYGAYARKAAQALQQGQNGEEYGPHYVKYGFFNGAAVNSPQVFGFTLIIRCGPRENPYPYCSRR